MTTSCGNQASLKAARTLYEGTETRSYQPSKYGEAYLEVVTPHQHGFKWQLVNSSTLDKVASLDWERDVSLAWSPNARYLAAVSLDDGLVTDVYDTSTWKVVASWPTHSDLFWMDDSTHLIRKGSKGGSWSLYNMSDTNAVTPLPWLNAKDISLSHALPDMRVLYWRGAELIAGDVLTGEGRAVVGTPNEYDIDSSGKRVVFRRGRSLYVAEVATAAERFLMEFPVGTSITDGLVGAGSWTRDGGRFALVTDAESCQLLVFDFKSGTKQTWTPHKDCRTDGAAHPSMVAWSGDGRYVFVRYKWKATMLEHYAIGVFDTKEGKGEIFAIGSGSTIWLYDGSGFIAKTSENPVRVQMFHLPPSR